MIEYGSRVRVRYRGTFDDGEVFDSTDGIDPLEFVLGSGFVIPGFDDAVRMMVVGQRASVRVPCDRAYGARSDERVETVPMYALMPWAAHLKVGDMFMFSPEGNPDIRVPAKLEALDGGMATVDFNHFLAGRDLNFDIELLAVDPPA